VTAVFTPTATDPPAGPIQLYTDITSGPIGCIGVPTACGLYAGENDDGVYLAIFGKNFGTTGLGTTTKVYVDNIEVATYRPAQTALPNIGASRGRPDVQQINTQIGKFRLLTNTGLDAQVLPIKVVTDGRVAVDPNSLTFTVNPGNIYFVSTSGNDTTGTGTFAAPFRTVQKGSLGSTFAIAAASVNGAWGQVRAGDFIVMRGGTWTDIGTDSYFLRAKNKSGCTIGVTCAEGGGTTSGPITLMGYPGEDIFINNNYAGTTASLTTCASGSGSSDSPVRGAISSASNAQAAAGFGWNINIVNLRVEGGNDDGVVNTQLGGNFWRVVNNELTATTAIDNMCARAGGVAGSGAGQVWVGNHIHDIYMGTVATSDAQPMQNHGMYIGNNVATGTASYEIAYNRIRNIFGGNGFQIHIASTGILAADNVNLHHNIIHDVKKHGINIADGARNDIVISNNVVYNTFLAGIRFFASDVNNLKLYNNTFYNTNTFGTSNYAAVLNESCDTTCGTPALQFQYDIRNNIFRPAPGTRYVRETIGGLANVTNTSAANNLWFGGTGTNPATTFSTSSQTGDPMFISTTSGSEDLRLQSSSPAKNNGTTVGANANVVSSVVTDDNDIADASLTRITRPQGAAYDIGAYEYH